MRQLFAMLERVAVSDTTVRIEGETDTGKELAAEALNDHSGRASGPSIVFDCSAVTTHLIESALFGYVVGVFTGAVSVRQGAFEAVDGGTLFLDEVGEPPIELQPKLLRALEQLTIRRVDANDSHQVDVRIVAATNRSLAAEVDAGRFREDLYYRLAVVKLELPPLRERLTDVPLLASRFASAIAKREGIDAELPEDLIRRWQTEAWPGNVRELRNSVARAISMRPETYRMSASRSAPKTPAIDLSVPSKAGTRPHHRAIRARVHQCGARRNRRQRHPELQSSQASIESSFTGQSPSTAFAPIPKVAKTVARPVTGARATVLAALLLVGCDINFFVCETADLEALATLPDRLSETGVDGPDVIAYVPQFELWSDGATKRRWFQLPADQPIDTSAPDSWSFPVGTRVWKEFSRDGVRIETRILSKTAPGVRGWAALSYVWNRDESEAFAEPVGRLRAGGTDHNVPAAGECAACHGGRKQLGPRALSHSARPR